MAPCAGRGAAGRQLGRGVGVGPLVLPDPPAPGRGRRTLWTDAAPDSAPQEVWRTSFRATQQMLPLWPLQNVSGSDLGPCSLDLHSCQLAEPLGVPILGGPCLLSTATSGGFLGMCCVAPWNPVCAKAPSLSQSRQPHGPRGFPVSVSPGTVIMGCLPGWPLLPCVLTPLTLEARLADGSSGELPSTGLAVTTCPGESSRCLLMTWDD